MKINKLTATFGKFQNDSISFHQGLNVIYAPNESGKSTWCAFIMAMLYGINSNERGKNGALPAKRKYEPWSGMPMEGKMELTADSCDITLMRMTRFKNAPMREFSAYYSGTDIPVEGMTGQNAGEQLTGVTKDVFARSAFIGQGASAVTGNPEMEKRIQAILSTGEEEVSVSEADARLGNWQRKRKNAQNGSLPKTEEKLNQISQTLEAAVETAREIETGEAKLTDCKKQCSEIENDLIRERRAHRKKIMQEISSARDKARTLSEEQNQALEELMERRADLQKSIFKRRNMEEVEEEAENDLLMIQQLQASARIGLIWIPTVICFLLSLLGAYIYQNVYPMLAVVIISALFCLAAIVLMGVVLRKYSRVKESKSEAERILRKYKALNVEDITAKLDEYHAQCMAARKAEETEAKISKAVDEAYYHLTELEAKAAKEMDVVRGNSAIAAKSRELALKRKEISHLTEVIAEKRGRLAIIGDPVVLKSEIMRLEENREALQKEFEEIELARQVLKEADEEIQRKFAPQLGKIASEYMSFVTDGRYEDVLLNRNFSAMAKTKDDAVARSTEYLSAGTTDILYLAVRLAVCEIALPGPELCPLILDDALVNMDEKRYAQAMRLLGEIAKERQVILFTCRQ